MSTTKRPRRTPKKPRPAAIVARLRARRAAAKKRGVALMLVIGALTVLTVFLTELQEDTTAELSAALAERDALRAEYYARSAINLSRLLIALEPAVRKAVGPMASILMGGKKIPQIPVWEFTDLVLGPFNDPNASGAFTGAIGPADYSQAKNLGLSGGGHFELKIVDEDAKINLNEAAASTPGPEIRLGNRLQGLFAPTTYDPMFQGRDPDNQFSDRTAICAAMIDWADYDQNQFSCTPPGPGAAQAPVNNGAEDNFYQLIGQPYFRKDAPYDSLQELRLVRGVGDDFWNTFVDPDPSDPKKRVLTVWGQGTVNVNSANAQTLLAITCAAAPEAPLCIDPNQMESFIMGVTLAKSFIAGAPLFQSTDDFVKTMQGKGLIGPILTSLGVQPVLFKSPAEVKKGINVASKMFSIYADGVVPGYKKTTRIRIHAVVDFRAAGKISSGQSFGIGGVTPTMIQNVNNGGAAPTAANQAASDQANALAGSPDAYAQVLGKDPAGLVVYYRVE
ncbi:MAG TPA: type II secretion system protein GspK [Minicystis sp.]|nr:type II secretion system protein GspK [Minicystis sp.]